MAASTTITTFDSRRRRRCCGRDRGLRVDRPVALPPRVVMAGVELVDEQLAVQPQVLGIGAQEALGIGRPGQDVELLLFERPEVLSADRGVGLDLAECQAAAFACLLQ